MTTSLQLWCLHLQNFYLLLFYNFKFLLFDILCLERLYTFGFFYFLINNFLTFISMFKTVSIHILVLFYSSVVKLPPSIYTYIYIKYFFLFAVLHILQFLLKLGYVELYNVETMEIRSSAFFRFVFASYKLLFILSLFMYCLSISINFIFFVVHCHWSLSFT